MELFFKYCDYWQPSKHFYHKMSKIATMDAGATTTTDATPATDASE